jgi:hypothetical protein
MREQHEVKWGPGQTDAQRMNARLALPRLRNVPRSTPAGLTGKSWEQFLAMPMVAVDAANCLSGNDVRTALQPLWYPVAALTDPSRAKALRRFTCGTSSARSLRGG